MHIQIAGWNCEVVEQPGSLMFTKGRIVAMATPGWECPDNIISIQCYTDNTAGEIQLSDTVKYKKERGVVGYLETMERYLKDLEERFQRNSPKYLLEYDSFYVDNELDVHYEVDVEEVDVYIDSYYACSVSKEKSPELYESIIERHPEIPERIEKIRALDKRNDKDGINYT